VVYVYLSYGIHNCMNIVTGRAGEGQGVLLRALEPTLGLDTMITRRGLSNPKLLTNGPGRLTQALGVTRAHSGVRLGSEITLRPPAQPVDPSDIIAGPRIGISQAKDFPWRFVLSR
jgi:DNA-3-methyladenine glycosylase